MDLIASAGPTQALAAAPRPESSLSARARAAAARAERRRLRPSDRDLDPRPAGGRSPPARLRSRRGAVRKAISNRLGTFAVRAAQALRAGERARRTSLELERSSALLTVVGQAIAELSLAHTIDTAVARVSELLRVERVAIYLGDGNRLSHEAGGDSSAELAVAERLLELAFGPLRAQGILHVTDARADLNLAPVRDAVIEANVESILALPLVAREEVVGLLTVYLPFGRELEPNELALLSALASQLAVAAQNAQLHERTERLATERKEALAAERESAKQLGALYEISRSFAQSLSLDATLEAVTSAAVDLLDADAAVIRMKGERGDQLVPHAAQFSDQRLAAPLRPLLEREQSVDKLPGRRLFRMGKPLVLDPAAARRARRLVRAARPVPRAGRDRLRRPDCDLGRAPRDPYRRLPRPVAPPRRRAGGDGALRRGTGRARHRERTAHAGAQGLRGHDAALAPPAWGPGCRWPRGRSRLRALGADRGRRRRLRLPDAAGREARSRAGRRERPRNRGHGRHGPRQVRVPVARPPVPGSGGPPGAGERGGAR